MISFLAPRSDNPTARNASLAGKNLTSLADCSVQCIVTSPQGHNSISDANSDEDHRNPMEFISELRAIFSELYRVLAETGTAWLNLRDGPEFVSQGRTGFPWLTALALQKDGWIVRNAIVWRKQSSDYETVFLLTKQQRYFFDLDSIRVPLSSGKVCVDVRHGYGKNPGDLWEPQRLCDPCDCQFPISVPWRCITAGCPEDGTVLDPFCCPNINIAARKASRTYIGVNSHSRRRMLPDCEVVA